jgi:neutral ceramidase
MSRAARWVKWTVVALLVGCVALAAWLSVPHCHPDTAPMTLASIQRGEGELRAGANRVEVKPAFPVVGGAGYAPPRREVSRADSPLYARALVIEQGSLRFAWVELELVTSPSTLREAIARQAASLGVSRLWLSVTHTHSSLGGYDPRLVSEIVGTGRFRPDVESMLVKASVDAIRNAIAALEPVTVAYGSEPTEGFAQPRSGTFVDRQLTVLKFQGTKPVAQTWVVAGHPTILSRHHAALDGDYPGEVARRMEAEGEGITFILQGAAGNARVSSALTSPVAAAEFLIDRAKRVPLGSIQSPVLELTAHQATLPAPDASRWGWKVFETPLENVLCRAVPASVTLETLVLGDFKVLAVPGEPTATAGEALSAASAARVVGLTNGYLGYIEDSQQVERGQGEARRQYFTPELLPSLLRALEAH